MVAPEGAVERNSEAKLIPESKEKSEAVEFQEKSWAEVVEGKSRVKSKGRIASAVEEVGRAEE